MKKKQQSKKREKDEESDEETKEFVLNSEAFRVLLFGMMHQESESYKHILARDAKWTMHPQFVERMEACTLDLCRHFAKRASLFGQYRTDPDMLNVKKKKPLLMECRESDFSLAWQTIEQDSK